MTFSGFRKIGNVSFVFLQHFHVKTAFSYSPFFIVLNWLGFRPSFAMISSMLAFFANDSCRLVWNFLSETLCPFWQVQSFRWKDHKIALDATEKNATKVNEFPANTPNWRSPLSFLFSTGTNYFLIPIAKFFFVLIRDGKNMLSISSICCCIFSHIRKIAYSLHICWCFA